MSEHSCTFCRVAAREKIAQLDRFAVAGKSVEDFLNDPVEDQITSDMIRLMQQHDVIKRKEQNPLI